MRRVAILAAAGCAALVMAFGDFGGTSPLPLEHEAIRYASAPVHDPVTELQNKIDNGRVKLKYVPDLGYLPALLQALKVPVSSQVMVFSKTSFQAPLISPRTPRALYFNDTTTVGFVKGGDVLELADVDPQLGVIFYTLDQEETAKPRIARRAECMQCHHSDATIGVPGLMIRSVYPERTGMPVFKAGGFITDHRSPLKERWGGWYVTGTTGSQTHLGNSIADVDGNLDTKSGVNVTDLNSRFNTLSYLSPHSDVVALMTLEHQTHMVDLIARANYVTRMALVEQTAMNKALGEPLDQIGESTQRRIDSIAEEVVKYLLFAEEAPLEGEVKGTSGFAAEFSKLGPRDHRGRSLRDFELKRRMFRYPCSYEIYSQAFDELPELVKQRIYLRLWQILTGEDTSKMFQTLSLQDRKAILEILLDTKPGLPDYWKLPS